MVQCSREPDLELECLQRELLSQGSSAIIATLDLFGSDGINTSALLMLDTSD